MDKRRAKYICPSCSATTVKDAKEDQSTEDFLLNLEETIPCATRGCKDVAVKQRYIEAAEEPKEGETWTNL